MGKQPTLDEVMASEIKRDMAERYFGFRRLIEEDELDLAEKARQYTFILQKRISFDLIRIYVLLRDEQLIRKFLDLIDLHEQLFYDPYLVESNSISRRVLCGQQFHGWFRYTRFRNFILDCYENLTYHADLYHRKIEQLREEKEDIVAEIHNFYRQNDLSAIMHFLKSLADPQVSSAMQGGMEVGIAEGLDEKLRITPPAPIERLMTILPPLKPLDMIKGPLKRLIRQAYRLQPPAMLACFDQKSIPCDRSSEERR